MTLFGRALLSTRRYVWAIAIVGLLVSVVSSDWIWLARSGCLVVAFVLLEFSTFRHPRSRDEPEVKGIWDAAHSLELRLAIGGTLLWGFGDVPNLLY